MRPTRRRGGAVRVKFTYVDIAGDEGEVFRLMDEGKLDGAAIVIWTTTPWTMPGNRAIAAGAEIEYDLLIVKTVHEGSLVKPGDRLLIAGRAFEIRDVVTAERVQRTGGLAFGPRVYVDLADLRALPVLGVGARATWQRLYRVPDADIDGLTARLKGALAGVTVTAQKLLTGDIFGIEKPLRFDKY